MRTQGFRCLATILCALAAELAHADFPQAAQQFDEGHYEIARAQFQALAELGDNASQHNLGAMLLQGQGGSKEPALAVGWLTAAAQNGNRSTTAQKLGELHAQLSEEQQKAADDIVARYGPKGLQASVLPVPGLWSHCRNVSPARVLQQGKLEYPYGDALRNRNGFVILQLTVGPDGVAYDPQVLISVPDALFGARGVEAWMQAHFAPATEGGAPVESRLSLKATFRIKDNGGSLWDIPELKSLREKAITGDPKAQYEIGVATTVDLSLGVPPAVAHQLIVAAAQGGEPRAQYWAGSRFLATGDCGTAKGLRWLHVAADAGDDAAKLALALERLKGQPSDDDVKAARELLERAAQAESYYVRKHVVALLAASPLAALRDPATAGAAASRLLKDAIDSDPQKYEAVAAALAANRDFGTAAYRQETAIKRAQLLHWDTRVMEERLAAYRGSRPWFGDLLAGPPAQAGQAAAVSGER